MSTSTDQPSSIKRIITILFLILAGETIFMAPFMIARIFRPTVLQVFGLNNLELGSAFSIYGIVALVSYFLGGPLADRFSTKSLMGASLLLTAVGAWYMSTIPDLTGFVWLYAFYGASTILLFWAALIKATRLWGGSNMSGRAFGLLDGGRGLYAAIISTLAIYVFSNYIPADSSTLSANQLKKAMQMIVWSAALITGGLGIIIWLFYPESHHSEYERQTIKWKDIIRVAKIPTIYLQALILLCAYVGYKSSDNFALYAHEILGYDDAKAASMGSLSFWLRPFGAISAGFLADRFRSTWMTMACFLLMVIGGSLFVFTGSAEVGFYTALISTSVGIYGLRGLYYAIMEEGKIPVQYTGTAVGLMAVIGYTPEIFMGPVMGYMLDHYPGLLGHQLVFSMLILFGLIGIVSAFRYYKAGQQLTSQEKL